MSILKWIFFPKTSLKQHLRKSFEKAKINKLRTENVIMEEKLKKEQLKQEYKKLPWYKRFI